MDLRRVVGCISLGVMSCGGASASGIAVGTVGEGLAAKAQIVPRGGELCLIEEGLGDKPPQQDKPMSEACTKAFARDKTNHRVLQVLGAYAEILEAVASGEAEETTGQAEIAALGVNGAGSIPADASDSGTADAAIALAEVVANKDGKDDLADFVKRAGPHVQKICDALLPQLDAQAKAASTALTEVEKKRTSKSDRRCGTIDNKSICVGDSQVDRVTYASTYAELASLETNVTDARDDLAGFCAAHKKLEEAAASGSLKSDETHAAIVEAIKSARGAPAGGGPAPASSASAAPAKESAPPAK